MPTPQTVQPWQYAMPTEEALKRLPANVIPPKFRPRVPLRFDAQNTLLVSGLLDGGADIAQRPVVVDVPVGKGHVVLFANNPIYRGETRRQLLHGVQHHPELRQPGRRAQARSAVNDRFRLKAEATGVDPKPSVVSAFQAEFSVVSIRPTFFTSD